MKDKAPRCRGTGVTMNLLKTLMTLVIFTMGALPAYAGPNDIGVIATDGKMAMTYGEGSNIVIRYCSDLPVFNGDYSRAGAIKACPAERGVEYVVGEGTVRRAIRESVFEAANEPIFYPPKQDGYDADMAELAHKLAYIKEICPKDAKAACPAADGIRPRVTELQVKKTAYEGLETVWKNVDKEADDATISLLSRIRSGAKIEMAMPLKDKTYDHDVGYLIAALAKIRADYIECTSVQAFNETDPKVKADPKLRAYSTVTLGSDLHVVASGLPRSVPDINQKNKKLGDSHYWISNEGIADGPFTATKNGFAFSGTALIERNYATWDTTWTLEAVAGGTWVLKWDIIGIETDWKGDPVSKLKVTRTSTPMSCKKNYTVRTI